MEERSRAEQRWSEYLRVLYQEKQALTDSKHALAFRLVEQEIQRVQADIRTAGRPEVRYSDVTKEKPIRLMARVLVPVKDHPKFNFVGKLLGPKGNSLKRLQEETLTRMAILGRGSMRDKVKEEELRVSGGPRAAHLLEDLHVEIVAFAAPAEAYARVSYALALLRRYLIPDNNDQIRQEQMREMKHLGLREDRSEVSPAPVPAAEVRRTSVDLIEGAGSGSSDLEGTMGLTEDDCKSSEGSDGSVPSQGLAPHSPRRSQTSRVLNILDRARLLNSRTPALIKTSDDASTAKRFSVDGSSDFQQVIFAAEGGGAVRWLGLGSPLTRTRLRPAPYLLPK
ncbi:KH domain-containing, RNA-binding, signal transduction-associated protein 2-like [Pollicipes pollicipes]|uniref:KH domain-containing, RNA-binding, signal transduction-associated protein 2-like n=1 Tax=Pollicipes pollicipes TaxID=41117 RepID=UPI001884CBE5|nr:KH domain-containing, RNA-binding, signal transduction-associated protein 2-like [Pollicipes pollicipes]